MIMGAGKTTVVAPTLGLLLADGRRLVMEVPCSVLPHHLRGVPILSFFYFSHSTPVGLHSRYGDNWGKIAWNRVRDMFVCTELPFW